MILAVFPLPKLTIPDRVLLSGTGLEATPDSANVPFGATCWLGCRHAWPHTDDHIKATAGDVLFLSLSVVSSHEFCDTKGYNPIWRAYPVNPGTLFVVDPRVMHWLAPRIDDGTVKPFICLQWEVARRAAKAKAREIVRDLGGEWLPVFDKRYRHWRE